MAILTSLFSGVSGLSSFGTALSVVSNNIANMNTTGYKSSDVSFADVVSQSLGSAASSVGRGVFVNQIRTEQDQGSFETTSNSLDMAIGGNGFFTVQDASGAQYYTRDGGFAVDKNGFVSNAAGLLLQGYEAGANGQLTGAIGDINLSAAQSAPLATSAIDMVANLDSRSQLFDQTATPFDVTDPSGTSDFSTSISVYDSLGNSHLVTVYFAKTAEAAGGNTWQYFAVVNAGDTASGNTEIQAEGTLGFTDEGKLDTESALTYPVGTGFNFNGGATADQAIGFDFGDSITTDGGSGLDGVTQFGSTSAIVQQTQDGYAAGSLQGVSIGNDGTITGLFTNGQNRVLGQVVLANFTNAQGLEHLGTNLYGATSDSGQPIFGSPNSGGLGNIQSSSLELSNVDLAQEFVRMIEYQRGFQANARVITTTDDVLQDLVNLIH